MEWVCGAQVVLGGCSSMYSGYPGSEGRGKRRIEKALSARVNSDKSNGAGVGLHSLARALSGRTRSIVNVAVPAIDCREGLGYAQVMA
jgi:hypothetical protein